MMRSGRVSPQRRVTAARRDGPRAVQQQPNVGTADRGSAPSCQRRASLHGLLDDVVFRSSHRLFCVFARLCRQKARS